MEKLVFDGKGAILGRMASVIAKELLRGNSVDLINCEEVIVSGSKQGFAQRIIQKRNMGRGSSLKGPTYIRREDRLVKRMIRGMLPIEKEKGRTAYKRLMCYIGNGNLEADKLKNVKTFNHQMPMEYHSIKEILGLLR